MFSLKYDFSKVLIGTNRKIGFRGNYDNFHDSLQDNAMVWFAILQKVLYKQFSRISKYQL